MKPVHGAGGAGGLTGVGGLGGVAHGGLNGTAGDGSHGGGESGGHGGLNGLAGDGLHGGGESGVHGGEVWFGPQIGGLIGVCTAHGGLLTPEPGDGLHGIGVASPHGGLTLAGGESGQPELGLQRRRIAVSMSPLRTTTFGCCEYESEYRTTVVDASPCCVNAFGGDAEPLNTEKDTYV